MYEKYDEPATVATCLADISNNSDKLLEKLDESALPSLEYPQTVLQLLLQAYEHRDGFCETPDEIARCMLAADMRPMSEILDDATTLTFAHDSEKEYDFISGLIGRLLLKELQ